MTQLRTPLALLAALSLSACISFGAKPPPQLMELKPAQTLPADTNRTANAGQAITVVVPTVPQELATLRVPVRSGGGTNVAYLKDAQWVEMPSAQFARLLSETIAVTTGRVVLDPAQFTFDPGTRLTGQLRTFGIDADQRQAVVVYDAALARGAEQVQVRRFEAHVPIAAVDPASATVGLNQAANQVAADVAKWIGS